MGDEDHGQVGLSLPAAHTAQQLPPTARIQPGGWFIQDHDRGAQRQHARQRHAAHLAPAQGEGHSIFHLGRIQAHQFQGPAHSLPDLRLSQPQVARPESDLAEDGLLEDLMFWVLEGQSHLASTSARCARALVGDHAVEPHLTGSRLQQPGQVLH